MFNTLEDLLAKIRLGEDSFLELKEVRIHGEKLVGPARDDLADELAAFANGRGGVCLLGVSDSPRQIVGIPLVHLDAAEDLVRAVCQDSVRPPLPAIIEKLELPGPDGVKHPILKIEIPRSLFVHQSPGGYLHRVGSSKRQLTPDFLARLFQQRSQARLIGFDEQPVPGATMNDLSTPLWERFRTEQSDLDSTLLLRKLAMLAEDSDGTLRPSIAGVLMATVDPRRWLPNAFIQAVAYRGTDSVPRSGTELYQLDAKDLSGPLDQQVAEACRFVARNMRVAARKDLGRTDLPQYDLLAVFEALVNAVAHRDYSIHGAKIRLRMFDDRLEISSPGAIPNTMTVESLPYRQSARNEVLTSLLARCPVPTGITGLNTTRSTMMDKRGEGVGIILDRSQQCSGRRPEYRMIDDAELLLTISAAGSGAQG